MAESIRLMHYDPRWPQEFQQTRSSVLHSCQGLVVAVEHVGSTSLPGLIARPIVDCTAIVDQPAVLEEASLLIEGLNFTPQPRPEWLAEGRLLTKPRHGEPTHHVYLFLRTSVWPARMRAVRDRFLENRELAVRYEEAKVAAWKDSEGEAEAYATAKRPYFRSA